MPQPTRIALVTEGSGGSERADLVVDQITSAGGTAAGIMPLSMLADLDLDVFDPVIRTNLRGTLPVQSKSYLL